MSSASLQFSPLAYVFGSLINTNLHSRIPGTVRSRERTFDILAIVFAFIAGGALTFLAIFDAFNHSTGKTNHFERG